MSLDSSSSLDELINETDCRLGVEKSPFKTVRDYRAFVTQIARDHYKTLTEKKKKLVQQFHKWISDNSIVRPFDPFNSMYGAETINEHFCIRFLNATGWKMNESEKLFNLWLKLRLKNRPHLIRSIDIEEEIATGKAFFHKYNKKGDRCVCIFIKKHFRSSTSIHQTKMLVMYGMELVLRIALYPNDKFCMLIDMDSFNIRKNFDFKMLKYFASLGDYFPETLSMIYFVNGGVVVNRLFSMVKKLVPSYTLRKLKFFKKCNGLLEHFDKQCLLKQHGGTSDFVWKFTPTRKLLNKAELHKLFRGKGMYEKEAESSYHNRKSMYARFKMKASASSPNLNEMDDSDEDDENEEIPVSKSTGVLRGIWGMRKSFSLSNLARARK